MNQQLENIKNLWYDVEIKWNTINISDGKRWWNIIVENPDKYTTKDLINIDKLYRSAKMTKKKYWINKKTNSTMI